MIFLKNKLSWELKDTISETYLKNLRVLIEFSNLGETVEKKLKSMGCTVFYRNNFIKVISAEVSPKNINRLIELPYIKYISLDKHCYLCGSNILSSNGISSSTKLPGTGKGITIGIIDSGVYPHTDLKKPTNKIKNFIDIYSEITEPYDNNGHGTFISGVICGSGITKSGMYKGIAIDSSIVMIKAFDSLGKCYCSDLLQGLDYIKNNPDLEIKIILLPCELNSYDKFLLSLFDKYFQFFSDINIPIIVSAGHNGNVEGKISGFALLDNCITVGGIINSRYEKKPYKYSSGGIVTKTIKPNFVAAASNIVSLNCDPSYISVRNGLKVYPRKLQEQYTTYSGTSISAAYIAGICAIILEIIPELKPVDVHAILKFCSENIDLPKHLQGYGQISILKLHDKLDRVNKESKRKKY